MIRKGTVDAAKKKKGKTLCGQPFFWPRPSEPCSSVSSLRASAIGQRESTPAPADAADARCLPPVTPRRTPPTRLRRMREKNKNAKSNRWFTTVAFSLRTRSKLFGGAEEPCAVSRTASYKTDRRGDQRRIKPWINFLVYSTPARPSSPCQMAECGSMLRSPS